MNSNRYSPGQLISRRAAFLVGSLALQFVCAATEAGASVDTLDYPGPAWSPYLVGGAIGVLAWLTFYFSDKPIGASSFYAQLAGFLGNLIAPRHTASLTYFKDKPPRVSWGFVFVVAIIVGGAIAALTGGEFANQWLPPIWEARFGEIDTVETAKLTTANRTSLEAATAMLIAGAMFGLVFGFLLQKGGVGKYNVLIGQLLLQDWTVVKIILTAIVVGMIGVFTLHRFAKVNLHMLTGEVLVAMLEENLERTFARDPYDQMGGYVKRGLGFNAYIKIENPPGQRVQQVFVGDEELHLGRFYPTAFVTEQGVANKYGRNRQKHTERSIDALRAYLARHRLLRAELRGTFVAV